jgi:hypothetical protein
VKELFIRVNSINVLSINLTETSERCSRFYFWVGRKEEAERMENRVGDLLVRFHEKRILG